jgi:hypothetical protein
VNWSDITVIQAGTINALAMKRLRQMTTATTAVTC